MDHIKYTNNQGLNLLELAMVFVIVALIVGGIFVGRTLIESSQVQGLLSQEANYESAVGAFRNKYDCTPGDCSNATTFFGTNAVACTQQPQSDTKGDPTCNGNGNDIIGDNAFKQYEHMTFWQHLASGGFIPGKYTGMLSSGNNAGAYRELREGVTAPAGKIPGTVWGADHVRSVVTSDEFTNNPQHYLNTALQPVGILRLGSGCTAATCDNIGQYPALSSIQASMIDRKADDGKPGTGKIQILAQTVYSGAWVSCHSGTGTTATYQNSTNKYCAMMFVGAF